MLAKDLKELVKKNGSVTVRVIVPEMQNGEGNLSDFGVSVTDISTYLRTGMLTDIVDACTMPPFPSSLKDAQDYRKAIAAGHVYFVFHHADYCAHNESLADATWTNNNAHGATLSRGTAVQTGAYSGYDMVGFPPDADMSTLFEIVNLSPVTLVASARGGVH